MTDQRGVVVAGVDAHTDEHHVAARSTCKDGCSTRPRSEPRPTAALDLGITLIDTAVEVVRRLRIDDGGKHLEYSDRVAKLGARQPGERVQRGFCSTSSTLAVVASEGREAQQATVEQRLRTGQSSRCSYYSSPGAAKT